MNKNLKDPTIKLSSLLINGSIILMVISCISFISFILTNNYIIFDPFVSSLIVISSIFLYIMGKMIKDKTTR